MKADLSRYVPAGVDGKKEAEYLRAGGGAALVFGLFKYFSAYADCRRQLTDRDGEWISGAVMPYFAEVFHGSPVLFAVLALALIVLAARHYGYHYTGGSRSIYLMRRLPDKRELNRRCLALPLAGLAGCIVLVAALTLICYAHYLLRTPASAVAPDQWGTLWRSFMGGLS